MAPGYFKHLWITLQWLGCQHCSQMVTSLSLEGYCTSLPRVFQIYSVCGRKCEKNSVLGRLVWGDQPLGVQYPRLLKVVTDKNTPISSILGSTRPFSWNFNFHRNLSDSEIKDLEGLMRSLDCLHITFGSRYKILVFISFRTFHSQVFLSCIISIF